MYLLYAAKRYVSVYPSSEPVVDSLPKCQQQQLGLGWAGARQSRLPTLGAGTHCLVHLLLPPRGCISSKLGIRSWSPALNPGTPTPAHVGIFLWSSVRSMCAILLIGDTGG